MQNSAVDQLFPDFEPDLSWEESPTAENAVTPSLPTILLNAALGIAVVGTAFYLAYFVLEGTLLTSTITAGLVLIMLFTPLGIICARLTGSPILLGNLGWGCGLTVLMILFFGLCGFSGALVALLVQVAGVTVR